MKRIHRYNENKQNGLSEQEFNNIFQELIDLGIKDIIIDTNKSTKGVYHIIRIKMDSMDMKDTIDLYKTLDHCDKGMPSGYTKIYELSCETDLRPSEFDDPYVELNLEYHLL